MARGSHFGASHELEVEWAQLVCQLIPSAERVRFTSSGTESVLLAIHLARMYTGRRKILRFAGHYHGWHASVNVGSGERATGERTASIVQEYESAVIVCANDDLDAVRSHLRTEPDIACIILEPTGPCSGVLPLGREFLNGLRELATESGTVLIFDEIVTGFRVAPGGAQAAYGVIPDLTTLAKVLSGGLPGGALAGKRALMDLLAKRDAPPDRASVVHLGTFNGNPMSAAAGVAMLKRVRDGAVHEHADRMARMLRRALNEVVAQHGLDWAVYGQSSCIKFLIGHGLPGLRATDFDPTTCEHQRLLDRGVPELRHQLRLALLLAGVDISLSSFTTAAHTERDVELTASALDRAIHWMRADSLL